MPQVSELAQKLMEKLTGWMEAGIIMLPNLILAALVLVVGYFVSGWVRKGVRELAHQISDNAPISGVLATLSRVGVMTIFLSVALGLLELDKTVTSLLAGVGVIGLALGFAFQDIAANFMSGFMMAIRRPFVVGDLVKTADMTGKIKRVALRATEMETNDGLSVLIPNKEIFQNVIVNYTRTTHRRLDLDVGVAYCEDLEAVQEAVIEAAQAVESLDPNREVEVFFNSFGDSSINATARVWLLQSDQRNYNLARSQAIISIKKVFDREGITIPFPIRTLDFDAATVGGKRIADMQLKIARGL